MPGKSIIACSDCEVRFQISTNHLVNREFIVCPLCESNIYLDEEDEYLEEEEDNPGLASSEHQLDPKMIRSRVRVEPELSFSEGDHSGKSNPGTRHNPRLVPSKPRMVELTTLREEFKKGPPEILAHASNKPRARSRIVPKQKLYVLYRYAMGYSSARIAKELGISNSSAKRIVHTARNDPEHFVFAEFVVPTGPGETGPWMCRLCLFSGDSAPDVVHHAYGHIWDSAELKIAPRGYL